MIAPCNFVAPVAGVLCDRVPAISMNDVGSILITIDLYFLAKTEKRRTLGAYERLTHPRIHDSYKRRALYLRTLHEDFMKNNA